MILFLGIAILAVGIFTVNRSEAPMSDKLYELPDIDPANQGGNYKRDYDIYFLAASDETGVPFALIKAHAIRESSLDPRAFRDENPDKVTSKIGWASRGLMQFLYGTTGWVNTRVEQWGISKSTPPDAFFDPTLNTRVAALLIRDNLKSCKGNLRDAINMYNTGKKEAAYAAPHNYVNDVLKYYSTISKRGVS